MISGKYCREIVGWHNDSNDMKYDYGSEDFLAAVVTTEGCTTLSCHDRHGYDLSHACIMTIHHANPARCCNPALRIGGLGFGIRGI